MQDSTGDLLYGLSPAPAPFPPAPERGLSCEMLPPSPALVPLPLSPSRLNNYVAGTDEFGNWRVEDEGDYTRNKFELPPGYSVGTTGTTDVSGDCDPRTLGDESDSCLNHSPSAMSDGPMDDENHR